MEVKLYLGLENGEARERLIASTHGTHIRNIDGLRRYICARFFSTYCIVDESSLVHLYIHLKSTNHAHH